MEVACPICARKVEWSPAQKFKPFCSERCKMIDLGDWATEVYKVPCQPVDDDAFDEDLM